MTADIMLNDRFMARREPAWHGLGVTFEEDDTLDAVEAVKRAKINYRVAKFPARYQTAKGLITSTTSFGLIREPLPDDPHYREFASVGPSYEVVQNVDLARIINPLTETWRVETVGALGYGETMFLTLDAGLIDVKGDQVHQYFLATDDKSASKSLNIAFTPVRVVCQNTLTLGLGQATMNVGLKHVRGVNTDAKFHVQLIDQMRKAQAGAVEVLNRLAEKTMDMSGFARIVSVAYPEPKLPTSKQAIVKALQDGSLAKVDLTAAEAEDVTERVERMLRAVDSRYDQISQRRDAATELYEKFNDEISNRELARTPWAGWQAVVEVEDYRQGRGGDVKEKISALFGERAQVKVRAFGEAYKIATADRVLVA